MLLIVPIILMVYFIFIARNTNVDWLDFIRFSNTNYENTYIKIDNQMIGKELGEICETAPSRINGITYQLKDGLAGCLSKGTKIYEISGYDKKAYLGVYIDEVYYLYKASNYELPRKLVGDSL